MADTRDWAKREYYRYTSDDGNTYAVKIQAAVGQDSRFGFGAFNAADGRLPVGYRMRTISMQHPTDGRTRQIPVGVITSDFWDGTLKTTTWYDEKDETGAVWGVTFYSGEERRVAKAIHVLGAPSDPTV